MIEEFLFFCADTGWDRLTAHRILRNISLFHIQYDHGQVIIEMIG
jgi:hypothetical protein